MKCRVGEEDSMIARIVWTILRYPVGAEVGFADEFTTEYRTVMGYHYAHGAFYVLFSEGNMVHMNQLDKLVVSVKIKKEETRWMRQKKVTKSGGITLPRGIRQETGILPGVPVDIRTDEEGIHISKHVPTCFHCGTVDDVQTVCGVEICRSCAGKIAEVFE